MPTDNSYELRDIRISIEHLANVLDDLPSNLSDTAIPDQIGGLTEAVQTLTEDRGCLARIADALESIAATLADAHEHGVVKTARTADAESEPLNAPGAIERLAARTAKTPPSSTRAPAADTKPGTMARFPTRASKASRPAKE